jgi:hypothetical protein
MVVCKALFALAGLGLLFMSMAAQAEPYFGVPSGVASIPLSYNGPETLTLSATASTGTVAFPLGGGTAPGVITVNTQYNLNPGRVVTIEAGFNNFNALTDGNGDWIPAEAISATFSCGYITFPALTAGHTSGNHNHTITLSLQPFFASAPGNYTGTLIIAAQAN